MADQGPTPGPRSGQSFVGALAEMWQEIQLAWRLLRDEQVPVLLKVIPVLGMLYVVSPIDLIVDVIPVLGQMDDIAVITLAVKTFIDLAPKERVAYHRAALSGGSVEEERTIDGRYKG